MTDRETSRQRKRRTPKPPPRPLDSARLQELALAYVARFATTSSKLESYLSRKIGERGWNNSAADDGEDAAGGIPDLTEISARFVELGYIDDEAYARSRSGGLLRRGFGPRRVSQDLYAAGIDEQTRAELAPNEAAIRAAALAMARKRRFGPYAPQEPDRDKKQKQIAAMLRAGHGFDTIRAIMDAASISAAEDWAAENEDEDF